MAHPGNDNTAGFQPIKRFAYEGSAFLRFPVSHTITRWNQGWTVGTSFGRFGDWVSFDDLPESVKTAGFAQAVGVGLEPAQSLPTTEICGSAGEVAAEPELGNHFYFGKERYSQLAEYTQQEMLRSRRHEGWARHIVHTMIGLYAPDELRQRVAWSLSQIIVIGAVGSTVLEDHSEVWTSFYDILVRHAFGSYRDILREGSHYQ